MLAAYPASPAGEWEDSRHMEETLRAVQGTEAPEQTHRVHVALRSTANVKPVVVKEY